MDAPICFLIVYRFLRFFVSGVAIPLPYRIGRGAPWCSLTISGGAVSSFQFHNFKELTKLPSLESLGLHEFGSVDLSPLKQMTHLKDFFCGYSNNIKNIDAITYLVNLEVLTLIDVTVNNFDFLNTLKKV